MSVLPIELDMIYKYIGTVRMTNFDALRHMGLPLGLCKEGGGPTKKGHFGVEKEKEQKNLAPHL